MKIRTDQELFDRIDGELSWRKADFFRLKKVILDNQAKDNLLYQTLLRSSIPIVYAHWEGFIKEAALSYLNFISIRKLPFRSLNSGSLSLYLIEEFLNQNNSTNFEKAISIIEFFEKKLDERSNLNSIPDPIKTRSNLNSDALKEIISILELDYECFRVFEVFIDARLLEARNKIAHGEYREIDWTFFDEAFKIVIKLMEEFRTQIQNAVVLKKYSRVVKP